MKLICHFFIFFRYTVFKIYKNNSYLTIVYIYDENLKLIYNDPKSKILM